MPDSARRGPRDDDSGFTVDDLKAAIAGGICCSATRCAYQPINVMKVRGLTLERAKYSWVLQRSHFWWYLGFMQLVREEGSGALAKYLCPCAVTYFIQGFFTFGIVECLRRSSPKAWGEEKARRDRHKLHLSAGAFAGFMMVPFQLGYKLPLSPPTMEKFLSIKRNPNFRTSTSARVLHTTIKFAVQGMVEDLFVKTMDINFATAEERDKFMASYLSGGVAGVAAAIVSHPAHVLHSISCQVGPLGEVTRVPVRDLGVAVREAAVYKGGLTKLWLGGLRQRCVVSGILTAGQFVIFDKTMELFGAKRIRFCDLK